MGIISKFGAGVVMTLIFVIVVPFVTDTYITPYISDLVGDNSFLMFSAGTLVQLIMFLILIGFMLILGGGAVFRWFGVVGVLGMIFAYYLLGDVTDAIIPLVSLVIAYIILLPFKRKKDKKKSQKDSKN